MARNGFDWTVTFTFPGTFYPGGFDPPAVDYLLLTTPGVHLGLADRAFGGVSFHAWDGSLLDITGYTHDPIPCSGTAVVEMSILPHCKLLTVNGVVCTPTTGWSGYLNPGACRSGLAQFVVGQSWGPPVVFPMDVSFGDLTGWESEWAATSQAEDWGKLSERITWDSRSAQGWAGLRYDWSLPGTAGQPRMASRNFAVSPPAANVRLLLPDRTHLVTSPQNSGTGPPSYSAATTDLTLVERVLSHSDGAAPSVRSSLVRTDFEEPKACLRFNQGRLYWLDSLPDDGASDDYGGTWGEVDWDDPIFAGVWFTMTRRWLPSYPTPAIGQVQVMAVYSVTYGDLYFFRDLSGSLEVDPVRIAVASGLLSNPRGEADEAIYPWLQVCDDGGFEVGWFDADTQHLYRSTDQGSTWAAVTSAASTVSLCALSPWVLASGELLLCGYDLLTSAIVVCTRQQGALCGAWQTVSDAVTVACWPTVYQAATGELWVTVYTGGAWRMWRAGAPEGPWVES